MRSRSRFRPRATRRMAQASRRRASARRAPRAGTARSCLRRRSRSEPRTLTTSTVRAHALYPLLTSSFPLPSSSALSVLLVLAGTHADGGIDVHYRSPTHVNPRTHSRLHATGTAHNLSNHNPNAVCGSPPTPAASLPHPHSASLVPTPPTHTPRCALAAAHRPYLDSPPCSRNAREPRRDRDDARRRALRARGRRACDEPAC